MKMFDECRKKRVITSYCRARKIPHRYLKNNVLIGDKKKWFVVSMGNRSVSSIITMIDENVLYDSTGMFFRVIGYLNYEE